MVMKKANAFSLVEVSIAIIVSSMIVIGGIGIFMFNEGKRKEDITSEHFKAISENLAIYLSKYGRLPCPALPDQIKTNDNFGKEATLPEANYYSCSNELLSSDMQGDVQYSGVVPTASLELPDEIMLDGWGNRITYIVTRTFVNSSDTNPSCAFSDSASDDHSNLQYICFRGQASGSVSLSTPDLTVTNINGNIITRDAVFILISHGENGYSAYKAGADHDYQSSSNGPNTDVGNSSSNNSENSNVCCSSSGIYIQNDLSANFDDIVFFVTRNNLVTNCNKYLNSACTLNWGIGLK
jgi:type II secretory pathway pseudopilin PulG